MVNYIIVQYKLHEIPFIYYLDMTEDRKADNRTDTAKSISLRQGIKKLRRHNYHALSICFVQDASLTTLRETNVLYSA